MTQQQLVFPHPPSISERLILSAMVVGNLVVAFSMVYDDLNTVDDSTVPWLWPILFAASSFALAAWLFVPSSRHAYAVAGALTAGAYVSRAILAVFTLVNGAPHPAAVAIGVAAWSICALLVALAWGRLRPEGARPHR